MKRILVAHSYEHSPEITKRLTPETWEDTENNYNNDETKKEEEERIFSRIKEHLKRETANITVVKKPSTTGHTQIVPDQFLYEPFIHVVHLVDTPSGIVPVEGDYKQLGLFRNSSQAQTQTTRIIKKTKCSFSAGPINSILTDPQVRLISSIYAVEGNNVLSVQKYLEQPVSLRKRLVILNKILTLARSLNRPVIDPLSIFISENRNISVIYTPTERIIVSPTEYMMFILSVLLDTYTVMERAIIVREMTMGINGKVSKEVYRILQLVYKLVISKQDTRKIHMELSDYITNCIKLI